MAQLSWNRTVSMGSSGPRPASSAMNKLNISLTFLLVLLVLCGFWPNFLNNLLRWLINSNFLIQALAVGVGVFGGMWADKKLHEEETTRVIVGSLEVVDAELQSNIVAVNLIKDTIERRPSLDIRSKLSLDKVLELASDEEEWISGFSSQLADNWFLTVLPTLSRMDNRKLFEQLINIYRDLTNMRLVISNKMLTNDSSSYTDEQKSEFIKMGDQHFSMLTEKLGILSEKLKNTDENLISEEKKLLPKAKIT